MPRVRVNRTARQQDGPVVTKHSDATAVRLPETMAVLLAAVSGFVDAFVYLRVYPVFTANQSGNLVLAGIAVGEGEWGVAGVCAVSIACYIIGAALVIAAFDRDRVAGRARLRAALGTEVVVLIVLVLVGTVFGRGRSVSHVVDAPVVLMVAATACAMGIQGVALRRVHGVSVLTTAGTGNVTTIGERLGRFGAVTADRGDELAIGIIGGVVLSYVLGAVGGALASRVNSVGPALVLIPVAVLASAMIVQLRARGSTVNPG